MLSQDKRKKVLRRIAVCPQNSYQKSKRLMKYANKIKTFSIHTYIGVQQLTTEYEGKAMNSLPSLLSAPNLLSNWEHETKCSIRFGDLISFQTNLIYTPTYKGRRCCRPQMTNF